MFVSFYTDKVKKFNSKPRIDRFLGQWELINCSCNHQDDMTSCDQQANFSLLFNNAEDVYFHQLPVSTEKIKLVTTKVFNITHLSISDTGYYICVNTFWSRNSTIIEEIMVYPIKVNRREGKACFKLLNKFIIQTVLLA